MRGGVVVRRRPLRFPGPDIDVLRAAVLHDVVEDADCTLGEVRDRFGERTAVLVTLADRLSNVQRLDTHPRPAKARAYYDETVRFILPLAEREPWFRDWYGAWREQFSGLAAEA